MIRIFTVALSCVLVDHVNEVCIKLFHAGKLLNNTNTQFCVAFPSHTDQRNVATYLTEFIRMRSLRIIKHFTIVSTNSS